MENILYICENFVKSMIVMCVGRKNKPMINSFLKNSSDLLGDGCNPIDSFTLKKNHIYKNITEIHHFSVSKGMLSPYEAKLVIN